MLYCTILWLDWDDTQASRTYNLARDVEKQIHIIDHTGLFASVVNSSCLPRERLPTSATCTFSLHPLTALRAPTFPVEFCM